MKIVGGVFSASDRPAVVERLEVRRMLSHPSISWPADAPVPARGRYFRCARRPGPVELDVSVNGKPVFSPRARRSLKIDAHGGRTP